MFFFLQIHRPLISKFSCCLILDLCRCLILDLHRPLISCLTLKIFCDNITPVFTDYGPFRDNDCACFMHLPLSLFYFLLLV